MIGQGREARLPAARSTGKVDWKRVRERTALQDYRSGLDAGEPAWCHPNNDPRGLAPEGWRIPTDAEWIMMENHLGGRPVAGDMLKSGSGWGPANKGNNSSEFTALPAGYRRVEESSLFENVGKSGYWWTATEMGSQAFIRILEEANPALRRFFTAKTYGLSVRCIKD